MIVPPPVFGEDSDKKAAQRAVLLPEDLIPRLCKSVKHDVVGSVLQGAVNCTRSQDAASALRGASFEPNIPKCELNKNRSCSVETAIRAARTQIERVRTDPVELPQISNAIEPAKLVLSDDRLYMSSEKCRRMGDLLIAIEGCGCASDFVSSNAKDRQPLADAFGKSFVRVRYE